MPRIKKPKFTHVFIMDYSFRGVRAGTRCNVIREFESNGSKLVEVKLENEDRFTVKCYKARIAPIERI